MVKTWKYLSGNGIGMDSEADAFSGRVISHFEPFDKTSLDQRIHHVDAVTPSHFCRRGDLAVLRETFGRAAGQSHLVKGSHDRQLTRIKIPPPFPRKLFKRGWLCLITNLFCDAWSGARSDPVIAEGHGFSS